MISLESKLKYSEEPSPRTPKEQDENNKLVGKYYSTFEQKLIDHRVNFENQFDNRSKQFYRSVARHASTFVKYNFI